MPLGGFAPCPLPLGGTAVDGLTAEQHARLAADLRAAVSSAPFAVFSSLVFGAFRQYFYLSQYGVGEAAAPITFIGGPGITEVVWQPSYSDEYDNQYPVNIKHAEVLPLRNNVFGTIARCSVQITSISTARVYTTDNAGVPTADASYTLVVW